MNQLQAFAQRITDSKFNDKPYRNFPKELAQEAKEEGIVIVYGSSDDLMEFDGAIYDEVGCYEGGTAYITENGLLENECEDEECPYYLKLKENAETIKAKWCKHPDGWTWSYETNIPHETFEMMDDDEKYCLGIVFFKNKLKGDI